MTKRRKSQQAPPAPAPSLEDHEREQFLAAVGPVKPLKPSARRSALLEKRKLPSARPRQRELDEQAATLQLHDGSADAEIDTGEEMLFRRSGLQHSVMRKLKRGLYRQDAELDLHGMTVNEARPALASFLAKSLAEGRRCVRVIHGKGIRSGEQGPVLRQKVAHWLAQRDEVLAYVSAIPRHGGTGAVYVLLRRQDATGQQ